MCTGYRHILLAEDDPDDALIFQEIIKDMKSQIVVTIAQDGNECIEIVNNSNMPYDLLFLDINMPRTNGLSCLKAIRQINSYEEVPVVMLSTASDHKTIEIAYDFGASLYLTKSCNYAELKHSIQKAVSDCLFNGK